MFITLHSAIGAGAALALFPGNWPAAFLLGWAGHYVFDFIPHGDDTPEEIKADRKRYLRRAASFGAVDLVLLSAIGFSYLWRHGWSWVFFASVAGSCLPDLMWGFAAVINRREMFGFIGRFHNIVHNPFKIIFPLWIGLAAQAVAAGLIWWRLIAG